MVKNMTATRVEEYLHTHEKIKNMVRRRTLEDACVCVKVADVANEMGIDSGTARIHLDIMEIDEFGSYMDREREMFCTAEGIERLRDRFRRKPEKI